MRLYAAIENYSNDFSSFIIDALSIETLFWKCLACNLPVGSATGDFYRELKRHLVAKRKH